MSDFQEKTLAVISKNTREQYRVQIRSFHERQFVELRLYVTNFEGTWIPTRKGLTIKADLLAKVGEALKSAEESAKVEGLL